MRQINRTPVATSAQPARPAAAPAPKPRAGGRRPVAQPQGPVHAEYGGGTVASLTPMVSDTGGVDDVPVNSDNLTFHPGGDPQYTVVDEEPAVAAPPPQRYVVEADKNVALNGHRFVLRQGKVLDASNYDIKRLKAQGVRMRELQPDEVP